MFDLALFGDGSSGPMGIKRIVSWLNERGYRTRLGNKWGVSTVHRRLSDGTYTGKFIFNSNQGEGKAIPISVPKIIEGKLFDQLRESSGSRNPKNTPPRVVTGDVLLTGLVTCPHCGSGMTTSTVKGGRYRYYKCFGSIRVGETLCRGRIVPMDELDELVLAAIKKELLSVSNLAKILKPLQDRQRLSARKLTERVSVREKAVLEAKTELDRLYAFVTQGLVEISDNDYQERLAKSKKALHIVEKERDQVLAELAPEAKVDHAAIAKFVADMTAAFEKPSVSEKRGYLRVIVNAIEVGQETISIHGRRSQVERAMIHGKLVPSGVPTFVRGWRTDRDSNPGDGLPPTHFPGVRLRPLGHLSVAAD